jgi:pyruvate formate lyase activating enzyme
VRANRGGRGAIPFAGRVTALSMDPIEKKPLYHFYPGSAILSVGFVGCNFRCPFCQNHEISQTTTAAAREMGPEDVVEAAVAQGSLGIAYTYSEPLVHIEYVLETARLARGRGLANVLVSNGFVRPEPAEELLGLLDAANIDLKGWDAGFYEEEIGGDLREVCRFLEQAAGRIHLEVTTLVIPTRNDDESQIDGIASFLAGLDPGIPYHLSCYYPTYRYTIPPTPAETVLRLAEVARRRLSWVYVGNMGLRESNTVCPDCGTVAVRRAGYRAAVVGLRDGRCSGCGRPIPIRLPAYSRGC